MTFGKAFSAEQESEQGSGMSESLGSGDGKPETFSGNLVVRKQDGESLKGKHSKWGEF